MIIINNTNNNNSNNNAANSEENLIKGVTAAETINTEDTVTSGEFKKQKHKNLNKTGMKRKYMDNSSGKCQRKLKSIEPDNGYPEKI